MARTIFIGDVHGCLTELRELVEEKIRPVPGDRIIMLGDLINRGPDTAGVVKYVFSNGFECLMGNHERHYVRHLASSPTYRAYRDALTEAERAWISSRPLFIEAPEFLAVHAGLLPGMTAAQIAALPDGDRVLTSVRTVGEDGSWDAAISEAPGRQAWWRLYRGNKPVFYGHWAAQGLALGNNRTFGLDSGCVFGNSLSGYCLETGELSQVKARRTYVMPGE